ncbi:MAG: MotA/TolQ/ExbB proton channel family protein [Thermodesulfobacteriota bacterium]
MNMLRSNIMGVALCSLLLLAGFLVSGNIMVYLNLPALLVVFGGTLGATLLSFPYQQVRAAIQVAKGAYLAPATDPDAVIMALLDMSIRSKIDGLHSLEKAGQETTFAVLRDAMQMLADNYSEEDIRDILSTEILNFQQRRQHNERVFRSMAVYAPGFGLAGSIIGLVGLLFGLGSTGDILRYIPIALVSTLYGILAAYYVFSPIAECIRSKTEREVLTHRLIIEGAVAVKHETNPHILEKKLSAFLTPAARRETQQSFSEVRQKYLRMVRTRQGEEERAKAPAPSPASAQAPTEPSSRESASTQRA